jgi:hydroxypyruvate reductase
LLISGGGSALLPAPADGVTLEDKMALNAALLASGLDIHAMNAVRRLFSRLKGGRLARLAAPARITQFLLSDVPGDRLESIASGPAVGDPVPLEQVLAMIADHALDRLDVVSRMVTRIADGTADLPLREGDPALRRVESHLLASNDLCRTAATASLAAHFAGAGRLDLPELAGDAATLARSLAQSLAQSLAYQKADSSSSGSVLFGVTGGETTVTLDKMSGKGGRAQEMVLAFADEMHRLGTQAPPRWLVLVGGTDGRDGPTDCAGAMIGAADAFDAAAAAGALRNHDSYAYLAAHDQLLEAVPTGTNLGDIAIFFAAGALNEE